MLLTTPAILVVEDDTAIRATLVDILELNGFEVVQASNGPDGLERAKMRPNRSGCHPDGRVRCGFDGSSSSRP